MESNNFTGSAGVNPAGLNPIEAIASEVEKAKRAPKRCGLLSIKSANAWIEDSLNCPDPKTYFHGLIVQNENHTLQWRAFHPQKLLCGPPVLPSL